MEYNFIKNGSCWSGRRVERGDGRWAPPARRRACSESARGLTIVSERVVTKFDDRDHPPSTSTRAGAAPVAATAAGALERFRLSPVLGYVTLQTYLCINLKNNLSPRLYLCRWPMTSVPNTFIYFMLCTFCDVYAYPCGDTTSEQVYRFVTKFNCNASVIGVNVQ